MQVWPIKIEKRPGEKGYKYQVRVTFQNHTYWIASIDSLLRILNLIGKCEDEKYPHGKGARLTAETVKKATLGYPPELLIKETKPPKV